MTKIEPLEHEQSGPTIYSSGANKTQIIMKINEIVEAVNQLTEALSNDVSPNLAETNDAKQQLGDK